MLLDTHISMPSQDPLAENKFSLLPRDLRKWIKNLPYVDQDLAVQQFYDGLRRSNRQAHSTKQRLAGIEIMYPVAHEFLISQRKYLLSQPFPLSKKANEVLKLQQNILNELAVAYKIIIQETVNRDSRLNDKKLVTCVHHAMYYLLEQYITLAQVYSEPPQSFWQDLCQLYGIAEHFELTGLQIKNEIDPSHPKSSPKTLFVHACLLSLSNLHTYGHGEAGKIASHLSKLNHLASLSEELPKNSDCTFFINLALREPVRLLHNSDSSISSKNRYIDASALVNKLKEAENSPNSDEEESNYSPHTISKSLSKRLLKKLTSKPIRASKRAIPAKGRLHLVIGMHNVIEILQAGHTVAKEVLQSQASKSNLELMPIDNSRTSKFFNDNQNENEPGNITSSSDAWDWISRGNVMSDKNKNAATKNTSEHVDSINKVNLNPVVQTWDISNASKGGYCLNSSNTSDYQSQVGDIVLIRFEDKQNDEWRLGVIRWMQSLSTQGVKMGIETVNGSVDVMEVIEAHQQSERSAEVEFILRVSENTENGINKTIITPPNAASNGDHFVLHGEQTNLAISCQNLLEKTIAFAQFSYTETHASLNGEQN